MATKQLKAFNSPRELLVYLLSDLPASKYRLIKYPDHLALLDLNYHLGDVALVCCIYNEADFKTFSSAVMASWNALEQVGTRKVTHLNGDDVQLS